MSNISCLSNELLAKIFLELPLRFCCNTVVHVCHPWQNGMPWKQHYAKSLNHTTVSALAAAEDSDSDDWQMLCGRRLQLEERNRPNLDDFKNNITTKINSAGTIDDIFAYLQKNVIEPNSRFVKAHRQIGVSSIVPSRPYTRNLYSRQPQWPPFHPSLSPLIKHHFYYTYITHTHNRADYHIFASTNIGMIFFHPVTSVPTYLNLEQYFNGDNEGEGSHEFNLTYTPLSTDCIYIPDWALRVDGPKNRDRPIRKTLYCDSHYRGGYQGELDFDELERFFVAVGWDGVNRVQCAQALATLLSAPTEHYHPEFWWFRSMKELVQEEVKKRGLGGSEGIEEDEGGVHME
ncbi:hypothetical protein HK097_011677 [Rhizophlyctis rosea]|uniref:Uncharacterized protein n=1 Tax=Rhizophlyctis rosea TaxID=64517 RepID=A0AAD5SI13_9FUNG|nr:hypothetical protein HK097_011677 [Rhizophlyctis rosea]